VLPLEHCPNCDGELKIITVILAQPMIEMILTHLGLWDRCNRPGDKGQPVNNT
jgi:hypothetical protein